MLPLLLAQIPRSAWFSCSSVSWRSIGKSPTPGSNTLVVTKGITPRIVRRTVAEPSPVAAGARPLITQFSRSRSSSRVRWCFC
ncbi:MAG TPA: hypothetical protein VGR35_12050 [Tepidisphaeraceae bacterium]|nr:hypothetical protein [Tepidisphaeraceae bacterium]